MTMRKIKIGDTVIAIAGKDKGRSGRVLKYANNNRVIVENIQMLKHHTKPNQQKNEQGGIISREGPIHLSNVQILNSTTNKPDRVGFKILEDGRKVRCFKSNGEMIDA